jgi:hypothetical protein
MRFEELYVPPAVQKSRTSLPECHPEIFKQTTPPLQNKSDLSRDEVRFRTGHHVSGTNPWVHVLWGMVY